MKRKLHNTILLLVTCIAVGFTIWGLVHIWDESIVPLIAAEAGMIWLGIFLWINEKKITKEVRG